LEEFLGFSAQTTMLQAEMKVQNLFKQGLQDLQQPSRLYMQNNVNKDY
jgi:hypothetical protein